MVELGEEPTPHNTEEFGVDLTPQTTVELSMNPHLTPQ